jgi:hypothetical protein
MTGDCHVRFCERLKGETPFDLLGVESFIACDWITGEVSDKL